MRMRTEEGVRIWKILEDVDVLEEMNRSDGNVKIVKK
jgi:hypothetical protein